MEEDSRHPGDPLKYLSMLPPNSESKLTNVTAAEVAWEGHSYQDPKLFGVTSLCLISSPSELFTVGKGDLEKVV